jgi:hypothetical protein
MKVIFGKNRFKWSKVDKAKRTRMSSGNILKIKRPGIYGFAKVIFCKCYEHLEFSIFY